MQLRHCWRSAALATVRRFRRTSKSGSGSIAAAYGSGGLSVKERLWQRDGFAALAFALVFALLAYGVFADSFQSLERYTYDLGVRSRDRAPSDRIAIIAIDDDSIRTLGRWPWPRALQAQLLDKQTGRAQVRTPVTT